MSRYQIDRLLGSGGMASVWLGRRRLATCEQQVAIKKILPQWTSELDSLQRFQREANTCLAFNHPQVVKVYDYDFCDGDLAIIMEYVEGVSLAELIECVTLPIEAVRLILRDVIHGVRYVHEQGRLHRDIKPSNILISVDGETKLADFGVVKLLDGQVTQSGFLGTAAYASPEQIMGEKLDFSSDLYSVAATFYAVLSGTPPFGDGDEQTVGARQFGAPAPLPETVPGDVRDVLTRTLVPRDARCIRSAQQFLDAWTGHDGALFKPGELGTLVRRAMEVRGEQGAASDGAREDTLPSSTRELRALIEQKDPMRLRRVRPADQESEAQSSENDASRPGSAKLLSRRSWGLLAACAALLALLVSIDSFRGESEQASPAVDEPAYEQPRERPVTPVGPEQIIVPVPTERAVEIPVIREQPVEKRTRKVKKASKRTPTPRSQAVTPAQQLERLLHRARKTEFASTQIP